MKKKLDVRIIHANSPQAKGRIERLFRTLQDRLVKELRLAKARTISEANNTLRRYLTAHNGRYMVKPAGKANVHRPHPGSRRLYEVLCMSKERVLRNDNTVAHNNRFYQVLERTTAKKVEVRDYVDGKVGIVDHSNRPLRYRIINKVPLVSKTFKKIKRPPMASKRHRVKWLVGNWGHRPHEIAIAKNRTF